MRKIVVLGEHACARWLLSSRADARSRPNGFSTTTRPRAVSPTDCQPLDDVGEHRRRDRQVEHRPLRAGQPGGQLVVHRRVAVVAHQHRQALQQLAGGGLVDRALLGLLHGAARVLAQAPSSHADRATPMTGTPSRSALAIWYSAGNSFLRTRSPVAPKSTTASARPSICPPPRRCTTVPDGRHAAARTSARPRSGLSAR